MNSLRLSNPPAYHPHRLAMTGATGALGRLFLEAVLEQLPQTHVTAVVRTRSESFRAEVFQNILSRYSDRITLINADLSGSTNLSTLERRQLVEADGGLWHFAASTNLHAASVEANQKIRDINEGGTLAILAALAGSDRPGPLYHVSTAYVCGKRSGVIYEHELQHNEGFRNTYEHSKNDAEVAVRRALDDGLSGAIFRPSLVVSDQPGPGPAHFAEVLLAACKIACERQIPLIMRIPGSAAINAVDDGFCIRALIALAPFVEAKRTYHLTARNEQSMESVAAAARMIFPELDMRLVSRDFKLVTTADRLTDRMLVPFKPYVDVQAHFDRRNLELDAPHLAEEGAIDPTAILHARTQQLQQSAAANSKIA